MAKLTPNDVYEIHGVKVYQKIIPDGTVWKDGTKAQKCGFRKGDLYKSEKLICGTGRPKFITIHNTNDLTNVGDDAEQYTRATYNENMNTSRVHFYVDDLGAWQNLRAGTNMTVNDPEGRAEVSWHAGDGNTPDGGNITSLSIEVIMGSKGLDEDAYAYDNSARLAAWLIVKNNLTIDNLVTHTYWVNKAVGHIFIDVDEQCTTPVKGGKWCPRLIFNSTNQQEALRNWLNYKELVQEYIDELLNDEEVVSFDNTPDEWAEDSIDWAIDNEILFGDEEGNYRLHKECSRQEMLIFLHRLYNKYK